MSKDNVIEVSQAEFDRITGYCKITPTEKHKIKSVIVTENKIKSSIEKLFIYKLKKKG
jgi:hypothetical protein